MGAIPSKFLKKSIDKLKSICYNLKRKEVSICRDTKKVSVLAILQFAELLTRLRLLTFLAYSSVVVYACKLYFKKGIVMKKYLVIIKFRNVYLGRMEKYFCGSSTTKVLDTANSFIKSKNWDAFVSTVFEHKWSYTQNS